MVSPGSEVQTTVSNHGQLCSLDCWARYLHQKPAVLKNLSQILNIQYISIENILNYKVQILQNEANKLCWFVFTCMD